MTIRVLVVDDSAFMRVMLTKMLQEDASIQVIGTARNGKDAVARTHQFSPDVITMDIEMPELNGISALKQIMAEHPTPVIMLSTLTTKEADATMDALQNGAFDFLAKPGNQREITELGPQLITRVKLAAKAGVHRLGTAQVVTPSAVHRTYSNNTTVPNTRVYQIVAIGTSTGGPRALETVLRELPNSISFPIVIVQHMPPKFTKSLADRLNTVCAIRVVEAKHGQRVDNGTAYIAPGGFHMTVVEKEGQYQIALNEGEKCNEHRPSVDVLFESLALLKRVTRHLVIMTGMGSDGAKGMSQAKQSGASTIVESEETCVVFGMPKSAISMNCVDYVVPVHQIASKIMQVADLQR